MTQRLGRRPVPRVRLERYVRRFATGQVRNNRQHLCQRFGATRNGQ